MKRLTTVLLWLVILSLTIGSAGATVPTTIARNDYAGNGVLTVYPYTFRILEAGNIQVTVNGVVQTLTTNYTVSGVGATPGGNVTFLVAPGNALPIIFSRRIPITQLTDYVQNAPLQAETLERNLDKLTMIAQMLQEFVFDPDFVPSPPSGSIPASIIDVKGDLIVGTANDTTARLAAGATGTALLVDPATSTGLRWGPHGGLNARSFGMDPAASGATNRAALQAAHDALPAAGGAIFIPAGVYSLDTTVTISKPVLIFGEGEATTLTLTSTTANLFLVTTTLPTTWRDLVLLGSSSATNGALVRFDSGGAENTESRFDTVRFVFGWEGVHFERAAQWRVYASTFVQQNANGIFARNLPNPDIGDNVVASSHFQSNGVANYQGITWRSGGGLKVTGSKFSGGRYGIDVQAENGATTSILLVTGNSLEDIGTAGITVTHAGTGDFKLVSIVGNEFGYIPAAIDLNSTRLRGTTITGNNFSLTGGTSQVGVVLDAAEDTIIVGNTFQTYSGAAGTTAGIVVQAGGIRTVIGENVYFTLNAAISNNNNTTRLSTTFPFTIAQINAFAQPMVNGSMLYCSDCTFANPCAGAGTGAIAKRLNGAYRCD